MPENVGMQEILEILRFSGRGLSIIGKGLLLTGKGAYKVGKKAWLKKTQLRIALSHSSEATKTNYNMLSFKTLEKITGGNFEIVRIPTEEPEKIADFCNMLKHYKINASVMKDLNVGDNMTEIAFDPDQAQLMAVAKDKFNTSLMKQAGVELSEKQLAHNIDFDEYYKNAKKEDVDSFIKETAKEVETKQNEVTPTLSPEDKGKSNDSVIDFSSRKEKIKNILTENYKKITKPATDFYCFEVAQSSLVAETEKGYTVKVPNSYNKETGSFKLLDVPKNSVVKEGDKAKVFVRKDGKSLVSDSSQRKTKEDLKPTDNKTLFKEYFNKQKKSNSKTKTSMPTPKKTK